MKKLLTLLTTAIMLATFLSGASIYACAETADTAHEKIISETTKYFENGSSVTIIVTEEPATLARERIYSKSGSKHYVFLDKDNVELWRFTVNGTFMVNPGISAICTEDSYSISISDDAWHNESASTYHYEHQAIGNAVFIEKLLFITIDTQNCNVILTCDSDGNLS